VAGKSKALTSLHEQCNKATLGHPEETVGRRLKLNYGGETLHCVISNTVPPTHGLDIVYS